MNKNKKFLKYKKNKNKKEMEFIKTVNQAMWQTRRSNIDKSIYRRRIIKGWSI